ncbi:MAG: hypothetical protein HOM68_21470 [Gemmatimonadetes bacterium]|jgi:hypothetical protein|nr:hypothetical protein [Gemmatimonadota bacterium]MBT4608596.1 hypothetical protein [Gemmatimonadota bacterium]MBT5059127.1 hypothetical protein [Gemmatimonadota bacterium]MBT5146107.1 hypothetical protein [Gemmatimonadota bacterium]MBT5591814.1 hypothetical protein [Gemmatimonadota bacterium]
MTAKHVAASITVDPRAFFGCSFHCHERREPPKIDGNLRDWDEAQIVPDLVGLTATEPYGAVSMTWGDEGLWLAVEVKTKTTFKVDPKNFWQADCFEVWIDTRDVKDTHRANRYCHHFFFLPGGSGRDGKGPIGRQTTIDRAREQSPPCPEDTIKVGLRRLKRSYSMEIFLPAEGLNGYRPREFDRIGFNYVLHDVDHGAQSWSIGRTPPFDADPSRWGTALLVP